MRRLARRTQPLVGVRARHDDAHLDAAPGGAHQRTPQRAVGQEIRRADVDVRHGALDQHLEHHARRRWRGPTASS